jgi:hypothetical protein
MFIAVRRGKRGSWALLSEHVPSQTDADRVESVPVGQLRELVPGLTVSLEGFEMDDERVIDLVGVDPEGNLTLGLCRLAQSAEIRQLCVARLMELAGRLRDDIPFDEFEHRVETLHQRRLEDIVRDSLDEDERADFSAALFRRRLAQNLAHGRFRLVLAVNEIGEEFRSFLDYLSETSDGCVHFQPVEFAIFACGEHEVLIPRIQADSWVEWEELDEPSDDYGVAAEEGEFDAVNFLDLLQELAERDDISTDAFDSLEEVLRDVGDDGYTDDGYRDYDSRGWGEESRDEPMEVEMSIAGPDPIQDEFLSRLREFSTPDAESRARRLLRLGREPSRTLPAGWVMATDTLSFQATMWDEGSPVPIPAVMEIFRLDCDATLTIDVPILRARLPESVVRAFVSDLQTNPLVSSALLRDDDRCEVNLDQVFLSDRDVRIFCVAVRKLVMGCNRSVGGFEDREAA